MLLACVLCGVSSSWAQTGSNAGLTGLWEYPTAEMPADGRGRFGYTHASPYAFYFIDVAWLPWFEVNARLSTFDNIWVTPENTFNRDGNGRYYMDKAMDLKAVLYRSTEWYIPSVAFGVMDMMGTELMKAWYGVATWRRGKFSLSMGYGTDRLNGFFAGVEWDIADWLTIKAEYSPLDYTVDAVGSNKVHGEKAESKYNYGLVVRAPWGTEASFSRQRGEEYVFTLSQRFNLNGPFLFSETSRKRNIGVPGAARCAEWEDTDIKELLKNTKDGLAKYVRIRDVDIKIGNKKVSVAYENYGHASQAEAMVRILAVMSAVLPRVESLTLTPRISGVPVMRAEFPGSLLFDIRARSLRDEEPLQSAVFAWAGEGKDGSGAGSDFASNGIPGADNSDMNVSYDIEAVPEDIYNASFFEERARHELKAMLVYEPRLDQTLADDYQNRWSIDLIYKGRYANGWGAFVDVRVPLYNDVNDWAEPDMNSKTRLQNAGLNYVYAWRNSKGEPLFWLFGEGGWLDENWFGANVWGRRYAKDGRWWIGFRGAILRDRDPESFTGLADGEIRFIRHHYYDMGDEPWRRAGWLQAGYNFADPDVDTQVDWGQFADGDVGVKVSAVRHWDDTSLGFWWTKTDTTAPNKDFTKAGVRLELPAEKWFGSWFGRASGHIWEQDVPLLSNWTLDSGRDEGKVRTPEMMMGQLRPMVLKRNVSRILKEYCSYEAEQGTEPEVALSLLEQVFPSMRTNKTEM